MNYDNWFLIHSGVKKAVNPTKGGFFASVQAKLTQVSGEIKEAKKAEEKPKEKAKEKPKEEKGTTPYEKWFYRNCDNNNIPDIDIIKSQDYESKTPLIYDDAILRNINNKSDISKTNDYAAWFQRHSIQNASFEYKNNYAGNL